MVKIENKKLIIEIETENPISTLNEYQHGIIDAISHYSAEGNNNDTVSTLAELLIELMPTFEQSKKIYS